MSAGSTAVDLEGFTRGEYFLPAVERLLGHAGLPADVADRDTAFGLLQDCGDLLDGKAPFLHGTAVLQAALAACHARARRAADTDWPRIAALYDRLRAVAPSPVVDLNRAIAHSMAFGPEAGLRRLQALKPVLRRRSPRQHPPLRSRPTPDAAPKENGHAHPVCRGNCRRCS